MFFMDGCTILHYIFKASNDKLEELEIKMDYLKFIKQDLFLLENQLPHLVLELLIRCCEDDNKRKFLRNSIQKYINSSIGALGKDDYDTEVEKQLWKEDPRHLLHLLRSRILQPKQKEQEGGFSISEQLDELIREPFDHIKKLVEYIGLELNKLPIFKQKQDSEFFCNIEGLRTAGIRLKRSKTCCLMDIHFDLGTLTLPRFKVDDQTISKFLNLIAYEMSPSFSNKFEVSSYIAFLDSLIDGAQDVKELRDKQILVRAHGSDEEVAKLFNEIGTRIVSNPELYKDVQDKVQERYNNVWMIFAAQFSHRYFQSPWSVIAFLAAAIILLLTMLQTVYTILGYYK